MINNFRTAISFIAAKAIHGCTILTNDLQKKNKETKLEKKYIPRLSDKTLKINKR